MATPKRKAGEPVKGPAGILDAMERMEAERGLKASRRGKAATGKPKPRVGDDDLDLNTIP